MKYKKARKKQKGNPKYEIEKLIEFFQRNSLIMRLDFKTKMIEIVKNNLPYAPI